MFSCPHCHEKGIRIVDKLLSDFSHPAVCGSCGLLSCKTNFMAALDIVVSTPLLLIGIYFALAKAAWWPMALVAIWPLLGTVIALLAASVAVSAKQVHQARTTRRFAIWLLVFVAIASVFATI